MVLLQDGADDIHFSACLEYELARVLGASLGLGTDCVQNGTVTPELTTELSRVRGSLATAIEQVAPHAATVAVLNYYQPIPTPGQIAGNTSLSGLGTNLVCTGLKGNAASTAAAAQVVLSALNTTIAGAVADARAHGVRNAQLVNVAGALNGHGICTSDPWVFSSERVPDATLAADAEHILAAKACLAAGSALHAGGSCSSLVASADQAEQSLTAYVWRTAHPTAAGQRALAAVAARALRGAGLIDRLTKGSDEGGCTFGALALDEAAHQGRAHHHTVGHLAHLGRLVRRRHADPDADRDIGVAADALDHVAASRPTSDCSPVTPMRATA